MGAKEMGTLSFYSYNELSLSFQLLIRISFIAVLFSCVITQESLAPVLGNKLIQVNGQIMSRNGLKHLYYILLVPCGFIPFVSIMLDSLYYDE